jgi:hypothetical protein
MTLTEFVEKIYLPFLEEKRASTKKGYEEIWKNHICDRVGKIRLRNFRTVNANRMLRAIADENDLSKTTLTTHQGRPQCDFHACEKRRRFRWCEPRPGNSYPQQRTRTS